MEIGNNIKSMREIRNLSQHSLAKELEISQKQLSRIENNEVSPSIKLVSNIAKVLGSTMQELLHFTESYIFNNVTNNQQGDYKSFNNTPIEQIENLYQKLLEEKERMIVVLQQQLKN